MGCVDGDDVDDDDGEKTMGNAGGLKQFCKIE